MPYRIPCSTEPAPVPGQPDAAREAYANANKRVLGQMAPLCAVALGSAEVAERVGPSACLRAVVDAARRESPEKLRQALVRVADVNSGKIPAPDPSKAEPVEALLLGLTADAKTFHTDLVARVGADEAARIVNAKGVCSEWGLVTAEGQ